MSGWTAAERGDISSEDGDDDDDLAPVRIQDFLATPRWRKRIRAHLLRRAGKRLQELRVVDSNNQWISSLDILKDVLARNPKVETGLRRLLACLIADATAGSLFGTGPESVIMRVRVQCRYLEELNADGDALPICLEVILADLQIGSGG